MNLSQLVTTLPFQIQPGERWAIVGPEAESFRAYLLSNQVDILAYPGTQPDGLLLVGALSVETEAESWLREMLDSLPEGAVLGVVEWQGDGPLEVGPDLQQRFKRGRLCRLLREWGFSQIELVLNHPICYIIRAIKRPPEPLPHTGEFVMVASLAELPKNGMKQVELFGQSVIVANTGQEIVAFAQACPHAGTSLLRGKLRGSALICPSHFYMWNVCTGQPIEPADEDTLPLYAVRVDSESGLIEVALLPN